MTTQYLNVSPSSVLGYKQYYRLVFDVTGHVFFLTSGGSSQLSYIYDHMQDSGALAPLSPNPVAGGDGVMVVDAWTIADGPSLSVAEAVRRLEAIGGGNYVRSIEKLSGIGDVTGGAADRAAEADTVNQKNEKDSVGSHAWDFLSGLGNYTTIIVVGVVAYAVITLSAGLSLIPSRKRG